MSTPPLRGKRGAERRLGERLADEFVARHRVTTEEAVDFDVAEVDREVEDAERADLGATEPDEAEEGADEAEAAVRARKVARRRRPAARADGPRPRSAADRRRLPDLPSCRRCSPRLVRSATCASDLAGPTSEVPRHGRHAGLTTVPHGAKSLSRGGPRPGRRRRAAGLDRSGRRDRRPGRRGARGVAGRCRCRRGPRAADRAGVRAQRARRRRDGRPGGGARRLAIGSGADPRRERPGAPPADHRSRRPARGAANARARRPGRSRCPSPRAARPRLPAHDGGRRSGRVRPARRHRRRLPAGESLPVRIDFFGDEVDSLRRFDPTDQRTVGPATSATLLPASEFLVPRSGADALRGRLGRAASRLPERLAEDLARFDRQASEAPARSAGPGAADPARRRRPRPRCSTPHPRPRRRRCRGDLGRRGLSRDRARSSRSRHVAGPRRARRHRRGRRVPVASSRRATSRPRRGGRPARDWPTTYWAPATGSPGCSAAEPSS